MVVKKSKSCYTGSCVTALIIVGKSVVNKEQNFKTIFIK